MRPEAIDALFSVIHEAAIDGQSWQKIVDALVAEFPGVCATLMIRRESPEHDVYIHAGYPPGAMEDFILNHAALCPWNDIERSSQTGVPYVTEDVMPLATITYSRFYRHWLLPHGLGGGLGVKICNYPDCRASLFVDCSPARALEIKERLLAVFARFAPHLRRSIDISRQLGAAREDGWRAGATRTAGATAVLDAQTAVIQLNGAMEAFIAKGVFALSAGRKLRLHKPDDTARLSGILQDVTKGRHTAPWPHIMAFAVAGQTGPNILEIEPLDRGSDLKARAEPRLFEAVTGQMLYVMTMRVRGQLRGPTVDHIRIGLGLTPKQAEAVWSLVNGEGIEKQAQDRGLSVDGVRWHFKNIYQRTGCSTQAELVRLVISLFGPARV
jgi:DNA-binding CsgD family transcriptional regulator